MKKNWYAVYTKACCEKKVTTLLTKKNIENFCPENQQVDHLGIGRKKMFNPLFPSYVFVYASAQELDVIKNISGVINFVYWLSSPAVVKADEIDAIKHFSNDYYNISVDKTLVNPGENIRFIGEPSITSKDNMISIKSKSIKVVLPTLGYLMVAEVSNNQSNFLQGGMERLKYVS